jgi:hypothetical protein
MVKLFRPISLGDLLKQGAHISRSSSFNSNDYKKTQSIGSSVESTVGKGSTFTVMLPIKPRAEKTKEIFMNTPEPASSTLN